MKNMNPNPTKPETRAAQTPHSFERWAFEQMNEEALGHAEMVLQVVFNDRLDDRRKFATRSGGSPPRRS